MTSIEANCFIKFKKTNKMIIIKSFKMTLLRKSSIKILPVK